eukprot:7227446-Heterocapsa_arctica.AAC.2
MATSQEHPAPGGQWRGAGRVAKRILGVLRPPRLGPCSTCPGHEEQEPSHSSTRSKRRGGDRGTRGPGGKRGEARGERQRERRGRRREEKGGTEQERHGGGVRRLRADGDGRGLLVRPASGEGRRFRRTRHQRLAPGGRR